MGRPRASPTSSKTKVSLTIDGGLLGWLEERVGAGREFSTVSHGVERAIAALREREDQDVEVANVLMAELIARHKAGDSAGVAKAATELAKRGKGASARSRTATSEK